MLAGLVGLVLQRRDRDLPHLGHAAGDRRTQARMGADAAPAAGAEFGRLLLLGCIQYFVIAVSAIVVIGPLFLLPLWAVTVPVMMVERTDIGGAFNRSMDLTAGRRLPILGIFLLWS